MAPVKLLLVESDPARAARLCGLLSGGDLEPFHARNLDETEEALGLRQFDLVLVSSTENRTETERIKALARKAPGPPAVIGYGTRHGQAFEHTIPDTISEERLPAEVVRLQRAAAADYDSASQLNLFDLLAFRQQLGEDDDLMREIIGIFFEESGHQLADLRKALSAGEYRSVSRIAHSLKGSLGNMHSDRARHWAQALELAAIANDGNASAKCLAALEQSISALTPTLERLIKSS